jgi:hypothetical protein
MELIESLERGQSITIPGLGIVIKKEELKEEREPV